METVTHEQPSSEDGESGAQMGSAGLHRVPPQRGRSEAGRRGDAARLSARRKSRVAGARGKGL